MAAASPLLVELRCDGCRRSGRRRGRPFDTAWLDGDRLLGIPIETDLADEIRAFEAGRAYETPAWMGSIPYTNECARCGNRPKLRLETLTARVRDAVRSGETAIYI